MAVDDSSARTREFGATLREYRLAAGYPHGRDFARRLGWSQSKVSRLETGARGGGTPESEIVIYLVSCGVVGDELTELLEMYRKDDNGYWIRPHNERLPDELRTLIVEETTANAVTTYEPLVVHGLLQTEEYARAIFREAGVVAADRIEPLVRIRMDRQRLLHRMWPPRATFYIHERTLREPVGDPRVMNEQLLHLLFVADRPQYSLRVVTTDSRARAGVAFAMMEHPSRQPVVCVDMHTASAFLERPRDIDTYRATLGRLSETALSEGQSRELFATLANEYDHPGEQRDAGANMPRLA